MTAPPAQAVAFGPFSVHLQVEDSQDVLFTVKAMNPRQSLSKAERALFRKLQLALANMRIAVPPGAAESQSLAVSACYRSPAGAGGSLEVDGE